MNIFCWGNELSYDEEADTVLKLQRHIFPFEWEILLLLNAISNEI